MPVTTSAGTGQPVSHAAARWLDVEHPCARAMPLRSAPLEIIR